MTEQSNAATEEPEAHLFRTVRGYYETKALLAMWRMGLLQRAGSGEPLKLTELVADGHDEELLVALLNYLTVRGYLQRDDTVYTMTARGAALVPYFGYLGTMVGAYEPVMAEIESLVAGRKVFGRDVHRSVPDLASGLTSLEDNLMARFPELLWNRAVTKVMDLGCGSGRMLSRIVQSRPGLTGVGVDASAETCAVATETIAAEQLADRVTIVVGDAGHVSRLPAE
ncbi:MAG TPA: class I SAM-dependent methyltransferase, partial [Pseudonocardiaceae bacterium]|nr:class I SAM-dependent methyltransferase [Pseudonocardiaceae bacterium]